MFVSDAKREANRRNALKSTGPKTQGGKEISRKNAVKHGLTASVVVPEDKATVQVRLEEIYWPLKPRTELQRLYVDAMVIITLRIDRVERIERRARDKLALRAMTSWDDDRRLEAEHVGVDLEARPAEVAAQLRQTPQGCDWLLDRWAMLANAAADSNLGWDEGRRRLAFDLLGTPAELRTGQPGAKVDPDGRTIDEGRDHAAVAREQIARLREAREVAAEHDEVERALAEADLSDETTPEIRRLRRYEAALHSRFRWYMARMQDPLPNHRIPEQLLPEREFVNGVQVWKDPQPRPRDEAKPEGQNEAKAPDPETAEDAEMVEDGPRPAPPTIPASRREPRTLKAEARRESKKRKPDRRRA